MTYILIPFMLAVFGLVIYLMADGDDRAKDNPAFIRLFKRNPKGVVEAYHAAWFNPQKNKIIEHFGDVGSYGETVEHARSFKLDDIEQIQDLLLASRQNYFVEFAPEDFNRLTVEFKFNPNNEVDKKRALVMRSRMRKAIDKEISWTGLGKSTKEKYQKDMMKILFDVTDFEMASYAIDNILKGIATPEYEIVKNRKRRAA